jgi:hypothetical protein
MRAAMQAQEVGGRPVDGLAAHTSAIVDVGMSKRRPSKFQMPSSPLGSPHGLALRHRACRPVVGRCAAARTVAAGGVDLSP